MYNRSKHNKEPDLQGLGRIVYILATGLDMKTLQDNLRKSTSDYTSELENFIVTAMSEDTKIDDLLDHNFINISIEAQKLKSPKDTLDSQY